MLLIVTANKPQATFGYPFEPSPVYRWSLTRIFEATTPDDQGIPYYDPLNGGIIVPGSEVDFTGVDWSITPPILLRDTAPGFTSSLSLCLADLTESFLKDNSQKNTTVVQDSDQQATTQTTSTSSTAQTVTKAVVPTKTTTVQVTAAQPELSASSPSTVSFSYLGRNFNASNRFNRINITNTFLAGCPPVSVLHFYFNHLAEQCRVGDSYRRLWRCSSCFHTHPGRWLVL